MLLENQKHQSVGAWIILRSVEAYDDASSESGRDICNSRRKLDAARNIERECMKVNNNLDHKNLDPPDSLKSAIDRQSFLSGVYSC